MEKVIELSHKFKYRENEINNLFNVLANNQVPLVLITGAHNVGKTELIKSFMNEHFENRFCWIDCIEIYSMKLFYAEILNKLFTSNNDKLQKCFFTTEILESFNCHNNLDFIDKLNELLSSVDKNVNLNDTIDVINANYFIVLDNAEYCIKLNENFIAFLTKISEFLNEKATFTTVLVSTHTFEYFRNQGMLAIESYIIELKPYTISQVHQLIVDKAPETFSVELYDKYVNLVLSMLYLVTKDLEQLRFICESNYAKFVKNFEFNSSETNIITKLWGMFKSDLNDVLDNLAFKTNNKLELCYELPVSGKYLIIAAYCASYNSSQSDKRFFVKLKDSGLKKDRRKAFSKTEKVVSGPKPFTFERLFHIYKSLQELNEGHEYDEMLLKEATNHLLTQIMTFISLKLIIKLNTTSIISPFSSLTKYRIADCITQDFVKGISKSVNFDLENHLEKYIVK